MLKGELVKNRLPRWGLFNMFTAVRCHPERGSLLMRPQEAPRELNLISDLV
ncbi:hypothetical protein DYBT9623_00307 [Dyadobacter sp. CECT 9623]|uniref:Uncharacterized protein n=1 Tax=Dyadobacter linearis TaxID=2823330 RepID=A0ABN7R6F1_9BACT|nr:hypothetical protein DYBT9623_00307 [Dyadobacter sp. CECT 9623]